jgi:chorismate mutase
MGVGVAEVSGEIKLNGLRDRIEEINFGLLKLFAERIEVSKAIGRYKKEHGLPVKDRRREAMIFAGIEAIADRLGLRREFVMKIFRIIIEESILVQEEIQG